MEGNDKIDILDNGIIVVGSLRLGSLGGLRSKPTSDGVVGYHDALIVPPKWANINQVDTPQ